MMSDASYVPGQIVLLNKYYPQRAKQLPGLVRRKLPLVLPNQVVCYLWDAGWVEDTAPYV